ncbi:MAG: alpha/beta hydrolase [Chloroflexi bacterium]|nr:alpha/beta hydrolase [Chloroflexota bacterium]
MECDVGGSTVFYQVRGQGTPILMLHGLYSDHRGMTSTMEPHFAERHGWRRIYLDLPGHGRTPAPEWIASHDQVLDLIEQFIDRVVPGERFLVAGQSYGGYLARGLVYRRGVEIDGVLLTVPVIVLHPAPEDLPPRTVVVRDPAIVAQARAEHLAGFEDMAVTQNADALSVFRVFQAIPPPDQDFLDRLNQGSAFTFDVDAPPRPFPVPSLFILGRQDHWFGYRDAWRILEDYPRATFAVLDGGGHVVYAEKKGLFGALLGDWLDRVDQWGHMWASRDQG